MNYAKGLDVSQWQGEAFPFLQAASEGYSFAYIRASVRSHPDPVYHIHRARAIHAGLMTGSYHYLYANPSPRAQALTFFETVRAQDHQVDELPPALDVEENQLTERHILDFFGTWLSITSAPLAIYTSKTKWYQIVGPEAEWPAQCPLWIADWTGKDLNDAIQNQKSKIQNPLPCPWQNWTFWQWTSKGRTPDYPGPVDLNYYNGSTQDLKTKYLELWA